MKNIWIGPDGKRISPFVPQKGSVALSERLEEHIEKEELDHPDGSVTDEKIGSRTMSCDGYQKTGFLTELFNTLLSQVRSAKNLAMSALSGISTEEAARIAADSAIKNRLEGVEMHAANGSCHVTGEERESWNGKPTQSELAEIREEAMAAAATQGAQLHAHNTDETAHEALFTRAFSLLPSVNDADVGKALTVCKTASGAYGEAVPFTPARIGGNEDDYRFVFNKQTGVDCMAFRNGLLHADLYESGVFDKTINAQITDIEDRSTQFIAVVPHHLGSLNYNNMTVRNLTMAPPVYQVTWDKAGKLAPEDVASGNANVTVTKSNGKVLISAIGVAGGSGVTAEEVQSLFTVHNADDNAHQDIRDEVTDAIASHEASTTLLHVTPQQVGRWNAGGGLKTVVITRENDSVDWQDGDVIVPNSNRNFTPYFQQALDMVEPGGMILIREGLYTVDRRYPITLTQKENITVQGAGRETIIGVSGNFSDNVLTFQNCKLKDLYFTAVAYGKTLLRVQNALVENVQITMTTNGNWNKYVFENCVISNLSCDGMCEAEKCRISGSKFCCTGNAYDLSLGVYPTALTLTHSTLTGSRISDAVIGVLLENSAVIGCIFAKMRQVTGIEEMCQSAHIGFTCTFTGNLYADNYTMDNESMADVYCGNVKFPEGSEPID